MPKAWCADWGVQATILAKRPPAPAGVGRGFTLATRSTQTCLEWGYKAPQPAFLLRAFKSRSFSAMRISSPRSTGR